MLGRYKKKISILISRINLKKFNNYFLKLNFENPSCDLDFVTLCGEKQSIDLMYSISSFYKNVGIPRNWYIYNDGSLCSNTITKLEYIKNVIVRELPDNTTYFSDELLLKYPTLWKMVLIFSFKIERTTIYADSDIVYFNKFHNLTSKVMNENYYLVDEGSGYFDTTYYTLRNNLHPPLNLGLIILNNFNIDWTDVKEYIFSHINQGTLSYWTDQSAMDMFAIKCGFKALPREYFVVGGNDSFKISHCCDYDKIVLRHFVGPVRHKMWQYSWKKVLGV